MPRKRPEYPQIILNEPRFRDCRTLIAGRGFSSYARDLIARENLDGRVEYLGWCAGFRLEAFFDVIDVLAIPSTYSLSGWWRWKPSARHPGGLLVVPSGLVEVLGDHAFYYSGAEFEVFTSAMTRWINSSPVERDQMARAALRRYETRFTDHHMARCYAAIYGDMAAGRQPH